MTERERYAMWLDHMRRGDDFAVDRDLARWSLARHARRVGRTFIHLELEL